MLRRPGTKIGDGDPAAVDRPRRRGPVREIEIVDEPAPIHPVALSRAVPLERSGRGERSDQPERPAPTPEWEWPSDATRRHRLIFNLGIGVLLAVGAFAVLFTLSWITNAPTANQQKAGVFKDHVVPVVDRLYGLAVGPAGQEAFADPAGIAAEVGAEQAWLARQPDVPCVAEARSWYVRFLADMAQIAKPQSDAALKAARADFGTAAVETRLIAGQAYLTTCR